MKHPRLAALASLALLLAAAGPARAQWQTQSLLIKPGWTAVYLFVDASYTTLDSLVGSDPNNPISEVWLWEPTVSSVQYVTSAQSPVTGSSQWANWESLSTGLSASSTLKQLAPNSAYLVHSLAATNYTWKVLGKPTVPSTYWNSTAINLAGFPTVTANPPALDAFLAQAPALQSVATLYRYPGGDLAPGINPSQVYAPHTVPVARGQAFWISAPSYANTYFGPFQVVVSSTATAFGDSSSSTTLRLVNQTPSRVTVNLTLQPSEAWPTGQTPIAGTPPLIVRGALDASALTYSVSTLSAATPLSWTLAPQGQSGSDVAVILGVDRTGLTSSGSLYAGILRFTDSLNFTEVDLPVSAVAGSYAGLWQGSVALSQVSNYLKTYQTNPDGTTAQYATGANAGAYIVTGVNTSLGAVAPSAIFPMRLILHNDGTTVNLMQRVFYGADRNSNTIVATAQSALDPAQLARARRISAVAFPWTPNNTLWPFTGRLGPGATLTMASPVTVQYDDQAANPFLHTYHPDHDNLDSTFTHELPIGSESYQIDRSITLTLTAPGNDYNSLTQFGQSFSGAYAETVTLTGTAARTFQMGGAFTLTRLSPIAVLTP